MWKGIIWSKNTLEVILEVEVIWFQFDNIFQKYFKWNKQIELWEDKQSEIKFIHLDWW